MARNRTKPKRKEKRAGDGVKELLVGGARIDHKDLTSDQQYAFELFKDWFEKKGKMINPFPKKPILRIGGAAGTGKSFLIRYIIEQYGFNAGECYTMAYTGKAVNVLRDDGILATTIHSAVMNAVDSYVYDEYGNVVTKRGIPLITTKYVFKKKLPRTVQLLIVDEASFLPKSMELKCMKYGIPILETGDPVQLPPVGDDQAFFMNNVDYFMMKTVRQTAGNEILEVATRLRSGKNIDTSKYHDNVLFLKQQATLEETFFRFYPFFKSCDMIITSTNKQRQIITDLYREYVVGTKSPFPIKGEKMICRKNNQSLGIEQYILTNGTSGRCLNDVGKSLVDTSHKLFYMDFQPEHAAGTDLYYPNLACDMEFFLKPYGQQLSTLDYRKPGEKFEFGYVITAHLCQGSTVDTVLYLDCPYTDYEYLLRLRYTVMTRARKRVFYLLPYNPYNNYNDLMCLKERLAQFYEETGRTPILS